MIDLSAATVSITVEAKDLRAGDRVIESRSAGRDRIIRSYEVLEVRVGRFVDYLIADEAGMTWRSYAKSVEVDVAGAAFAGEAFTK